MLFNSYEFLIVFLPLVVLVYYALPRAVRAPWLTVASYFFYGWWRPQYVVLMLALTLINYLGGSAVARARTRRRKLAWLMFSVAGSLAVLGFFKYTDFLIHSWNAVNARTGFGRGLLPLGIVLPIGISFYTFQSVSYPIDIYRGVCEPTRGFIDFACYVSLFPQLIAGPIVRYNEVADQLRERTHSMEKIARGLVFFIVGLAKKVLLADAMARAVALAFDHGPLGAGASWIGLLAYSFQIYFDFSGYSDMAIGLGLLIGFEFPQNFNSPYKALGIRDFWRRWHMSLSRWLRDYLYVSLGGSRRGAVRTCVNVLLTMFLGGLWHGANWTFICWGLYYAALIGLEHALARFRVFGSLPAPAKRAATFLLVAFGWLLFRSPTLGAAGALFAGLFGGRGWGRVPKAMLDPWFLGAAVVCAAIAWGGRNLFAWRWRITERTALWAIPLFLAALFKVLTSDYSPFLYFQF